MSDTDTRRIRPLPGGDTPPARPTDLEDRNRLRALIAELSVLASYDANTLNGPHFWQAAYQHLDEARAIAAGHVPPILPEDGLTYLAAAFKDYEERHGR